VVDAGLIDYVNVTYGSCRRSHKIIGAMHEPTGYELPTSEVVTKATFLPTIVTGRFRTLAEIDEVIDDGLADMVAMTRAHIADPEIVLKTMQGRADEVRPCLACNQGCLGGFGQGRLACTMNADVGFEAQRVGAYERALVSKRVLVVGGGAAGLEAARVAALRGHRVTLCEADTETGGNIRWSRLFHERATIGDGIDWLEADCVRRGVDIRLGTRVDDDIVRGIDPEVVVIATGGAQPADRGNYTSIDIARADSCPPGVRTAVIVDRFGAYEVLGTAEKLIRWGVDVTILTPHPMLAPKIMFEGVIVPTLERMRQGPGNLTVTTRWDEASGLPQADAVIVIDRVAAPLGLGAETLAGREVHHVGDAAQPGNLWAAVRTGNEVGRTI
jgi:hypothetical protein